MKYGLTLPNGGQCGDPRTLAEFASLAEQAGWDAVFLEDYIVWQGHRDVPTYDPWISLAAMALHTERIRVGTMVTPLARRRPWKLARETVSVDRLSNGRLILGVGLGDTTIDTSFTDFGEVVDLKQRARMLDEALEVLVGLWSGQPFTYSGEYYELYEVTLLPQPVQRPRIPIWVGGIWPLKGPVRRALRWDGSCLYKVPPEEDWTPEDVQKLKALAEAERTAATPFDIVVGHASWQRASDWERERACIRNLAEAGATWWTEYVPPDDSGVMRAWIAQGPLRID